MGKKEETGLEIWKGRELGRTLMGTDLLPFGKSQIEHSMPKDDEEEIVTGRHVEPGDVIVPTLGLIQKTSRCIDEQVEGAKPGLFMLSTTQEVFQPPIRAMVIFYNKSRALFPKVGSGLQRCISKDMIVGTFYGNCDECPHKEWGQEDNAKPPCSEAHNFYLWLPQGLAVVRFARKGRRNAQNFVTEVLMARQNWWAAPVLIGSKLEVAQVEGTQHQYFVPTIKWDRVDVVPKQLRDQCRVHFDEVDVAFKTDRLQQHGVEEEAELPY